MVINTKIYSENQFYDISGASYIGKPKSNTAMFVSKKIGNLIETLKSVSECLVFAEEGLEVPKELSEKHCFVFSANPQKMYADFTEKFYLENEDKERRLSYTITENGAYICENASVGAGTLIETGAVIGPNVIIGNNCRVYSGAVIKNAIIGNNVIIGEKAVVGASGFTMADSEDGNKIRIYSLGKVIVGDNVEIGVHDNVSRGSGGDTIIEDNVKIDALVNIGHDAHLHKNVEITAGAVVGGFVEALEKSYIGINAVIRNRIVLGKRSFVGMGAVVTKTVEEGITVVGNPAKPFVKQ